ncbi:hypothetical protein TIFTF001_043103 [Ficus carica]|uniref:Uncharacterized protein n=1 Tax=Ficus carica TaxID=3494 RepID=A0AA88CWQ2_FICCA|nr:hypothetical protein TIFTF001_043103 [Ficus carica]
MAEGESPSTKVNLFAEILKKINDPMVIVSLENDCPLTCSSDVIAVDLKGSYCRNNVLRILFPERIETPKVLTGASTIESDELSTVPSETQKRLTGICDASLANSGDESIRVSTFSISLTGAIFGCCNTEKRSQKQKLVKQKMFRLQVLSADGATDACAEKTVPRR